MSSASRSIASLSLWQVLSPMCTHIDHIEACIHTCTGIYTYMCIYVYVQMYHGDFHLFHFFIPYFAGQGD